MLNRPLSYLLRIPLFCLHDSILSQNGVSGKPGAVQHHDQYCAGIRRHVLGEGVLGASSEVCSYTHGDLLGRLCLGYSQHNHDRLIYVVRTFGSDANFRRGSATFEL